MITSRKAQTLLTAEQYLEIERNADHKSQYFDGEMFAMSGASHSHNVINLNVATALRTQLRKRGCFAYAGDMRVCVSSTGLYTYPDLIVVCGQPQFLGGSVDTLLNPNFLGEVLSPSTEFYDRGRKFDHYRKLESLREYLLIAQDRRHAELYTRQQDGRWSLTEASGDDDPLELRSINCRIGMAEIYEDT